MVTTFSCARVDRERQRKKRGMKIKKEKKKEKRTGLEKPKKESNQKWKRIKN
jgi:hypothetical protein